MHISEEVKKEQEEAKVREARRILDKEEKDAIAEAVMCIVRNDCTIQKLERIHTIFQRV